MKHLNNYTSGQSSQENHFFVGFFLTIFFFGFFSTFLVFFSTFLVFLTTFLAFLGDLFFL
jgi:hypothetical protein